MGVIGIVVGKNAKELILIESNQSSYKCADIDIELNNLLNAKIMNSLSEDLNQFDFFEREVLILDSPRTGFYKKVIKNIFKYFP